MGKKNKQEIQKFRDYQCPEPESDLLVKATI